MSRKPTPGGLEQVRSLLARERLSIDAMEPGRTCFLSHLGAIKKLVVGPWIGHRELLYALALANLSPDQRTSLGRAVLVDYGREFGVGRVVLTAEDSGLDLGGSSLHLRPRKRGPTCLYTWALGRGATPRACQWLLLRAQPQWALAEPPKPLTKRSLETLDALDARVVIAVATAVEASQIAKQCLSNVAFWAHPRFTPHVDASPRSSEEPGGIWLWPHDALTAESLRKREPQVVILVNAPEALRAVAERWAATLPQAVELTQASCPNRLGRSGLLKFLSACEQPQVLLRGDPAWVKQGETWLRERGVVVETQSDATQLGLFA